MAYLNQDVTSSGGGAVEQTQPEKRKAQKLISLAMTNFLEPTVHRLYKVKAPLRSASSVLFCSPFSTKSSYSTAGDLQRSGGLLVADLSAGKIVQFSASDGRYYCDLVSDVDPHDMCMCGANRLAMVDSNEWGSCVKMVSMETGNVLSTWGRQLKTWTPRAIATTRDQSLLVTNIHPQATSRLTLFTPDGREISQFGRADGPGDAIFRSPLGVACDVTYGRMFTADAETGCVKVYDARCHYVAEFGNSNNNNSTSTSSGSRRANSSTTAMLDRPLGLCCDGLGNVVVCDSGNQRVVLFSSDGRYLCTLADFRTASGRRWRLKTPQSGGSNRGRLVPVCVGLASPGNRIAIGLNDIAARSSRCFRKLIVYSVTPEL